MLKAQKEMLNKENEKHWNNYLNALERAKAIFESGAFDWNACAMALTDAKRELRRCSETKVLR